MTIRVCIFFTFVFASLFFAHTLTAEDHLGLLRDDFGRRPMPATRLAPSTRIAQLPPPSLPTSPIPLDAPFAPPSPVVRQTQPILNPTNVFANTPTSLLTPFGTDAPFGQQPLSPYSQSEFRDDPIDADLIVNTPPNARTSYYGLGASFNSDAGVFGHLILEERDFDWRAAPWLGPPQAWRGGGQRLRIEAMPGAEAQRYLVSFTDPFFSRYGGQPVSLNLSGFFFDRDYFDWDEQRFGGRIKLGFALSNQLSLQAKFRAENIEIDRPRELAPELSRSLGQHDLFGVGIGLAYDTRDTPYFPTEGGYLSIGAEQVFGSFDYTRGTLNYKRYSWIRQRPDRSGRHVIGWQFDGGITGSQTPIYENFFAGGVSTLRGFGFRHASPKEGSVIVGGELSLLGTGEYFFPITADDMVRGVIFSDLGAISATTSPDGDDFRMSLGTGLRIKVPALSPAPLAVDLAIPVIRQRGEQVRNFSLFINLGF